MQMFQQPQRMQHPYRRHAPQTKQLFAKVRIGGDLIMLNAMVPFVQFRCHIIKRVSVPRDGRLSFYYLDGRDWVSVLMEEDWEVMKMRAVAQGIDTVTVKVGLNHGRERKVMSECRKQRERTPVQQAVPLSGILSMILTGVQQGLGDATESPNDVADVVNALNAVNALFGPAPKAGEDVNTDEKANTQPNKDAQPSKNAQPSKDAPTLDDEDYDDLEALDIEEPSKDEDEALTAPYGDETVEIVDVCIDPVSGEECHEYSTNQPQDDAFEQDESSDSVVEQISSDSDLQTVDVNDNTPILVALGFEENAARTALAKTDGNLNAAADMLFNMQNFY